MSERAHRPFAGRAARPGEPRRARARAPMPDAGRCVPRGAGLSPLLRRASWGADQSPLRGPMGGCGTRTVTEARCGRGPRGSAAGSAAGAGARCGCVPGWAPMSRGAVRPGWGPVGGAGASSLRVLDRMPVTAGDPLAGPAASRVWVRSFPQGQARPERAASLPVRARRCGPWCRGGAGPEGQSTLGLEPGTPVWAGGS